MTFQWMKLLTTCLCLAILHNVVEGDSLVTNLTSATSLFSQQLYNQIQSSSGNLIYSPYSIHSALTMTSLGARGETLKEMRNVLGLSTMSEVNVRTAYHNLIVQLNSAQNLKLDTANAIFANPSYKIKDEFRNEVAAKFFATADKFDLYAQGGPEVAINDYVSVKTHKMIQRVLAPGTINAGSSMLLINTLFFNGTWETPFKKYSTRKQAFFQLQQAATQVDMMHDEQFLPYKRDMNRKVDVVELPFKGNRFGLVVALPHQVEGITQLENNLVHGVDDLFQDMLARRLQVAIPKFKVETSLKLKDTLKTMGMQRTFSGLADFSGINDKVPTYIDDVIHKAVIDVTEAGTTAAAVTVVHMIRGMTAFAPPLTDRFVADHPFMYFLRDKQTGQILFQGKFSG